MESQSRRLLVRENLQDELAVRAPSFEGLRHRLKKLPVAGRILPSFGQPYDVGDLLGDALDPLGDGLISLGEFVVCLQRMEHDWCRSCTRSHAMAAVSFQIVLCHFKMSATYSGRHRAQREQHSPRQSKKPEKEKPQGSTAV